jgi:predicted MFS family arabinose efflux permease
MDLIGRKRLLLVANVVSLIGWTVIAAAGSIVVICVGRSVGYC